jgi:site-specific DNA recombinase
MRAALYARVSTEDQAEEGYSIDAQLGAMRACAADKGWDVAKEYVDAGYSARSDSRPDFKAMITDAKARRFDVVLVHKLDRFSRRREDAVTYKALLRQVGINVISVTEPLDPNSPVSVVVEGVLEAVNEWYSVNLSREVAKGLKQRAEQGLWNGDLPFAYVKGEDRLAHVVPAEADVVRQAFEMYASGRHTFQQVASWLNETPFRPRVKARHGRNREYLWSKDTVKDMLRNPFYLGLTKYKEKLMPGRHQAIVSKELFDRGQEMRRKHRRGPWSFTPKHRVYLLGGLLRCAACGTRLWAQHLSGRDYYREESALRGIPCPNPKGVIRADILEAQVEEVVTALQLPPSWRDLVVHYLGASEERERIARERARLKERLRRLRQLYLDGYPEPEYRREKEAIQAALETLSESPEEEVMILGDHIEGLIQAWKFATRAEKRDMLLMMLEAVYVDVPNKRLVALQVKPAFKPLFRVSLERKEPQLLTVRFGHSDIVPGDPEGIRTPDLHRDRVAC